MIKIIEACICDFRYIIYIFFCNFFVFFVIVVFCNFCNIEVAIDKDQPGALHPLDGKYMASRRSQILLTSYPRSATDPYPWSAL